MITPLFNRCDPICIKLLDVKDSKEFYINSLLVIVGDTPDFIIKEINKVKETLSKTNKILEKYFGKKWYNILYFDLYESTKKATDKHGGDLTSNDWDDIDDDEFDDLLHNYSNVSKFMHSTKDISNLKNSINSSNYLRRNSKKFSIEFNFDVNLYKEDTIEEFKEKLETITKINYYKQYLGNNDLSIGYHININNGVDVDALHPNILDVDFETEISKIPINPILYDIRDNSRIVATDFNTKLNNYNNEFTLISIDSFIHNKNDVLFLLRSDLHSYDLIYYSFVAIYFPVLTYDIFSLYLADESELYVQYPTISLDSKIYKEKLREDSRLINELNNIEPDKNSYLVNTKDLSLVFSGYDEKILSVKYLFDNIEIAKFPMVNYIDMCINVDNELVYVRKINSITSRIASTNKTSTTDINTIRFECFANNPYGNLNIQINEYGRILIYASTTNDVILTKEEFVSSIKTDINKILAELNKLDNSVFLICKKFPMISDNKTFKIQQASIGILFNKQYNFEKFINLLDSILSTNIFKYAKNDKINNGYYYILRKNITSFASGAIEYISKDTNNMFDYLSDSIKHRNMQVLFDSKKIFVQYIKNFLTVEILNLSMEESNFYIGFIARLIKLNEKSLKIAEVISNKLKLIDPVLFNYSSGTKYPRICQKKMQPIVTTKSDPKGIKYKNWTYDRDEYYKCTDKVYNHLGMIVGHHPDGYCLPCCRKKSFNDDILDKCYLNSNKESEWHERTYIQYIMEYPNNTFPNSKFIDRKSYLPKYVQTLLNTKKLMVNGTFTPISDRIIDGSSDMTLIYAKYYQVSVKEFVINLINYIKNQLPNFSALLNYSINLYFSSTTELCSALSNRFILNKNIVNTSAIKKDTNVPWNEILISLMYYYGLNTILLVDNRINDIDLELDNLNQVNITNPSLFILKRYNLEYYNSTNLKTYNYVPITEFSNSLKKDKKINISIVDEDTMMIFQKLYNISNRSYIYYNYKQFNLNNLIKFTKLQKSITLKEIYVNNKYINSSVRLSISGNDYVFNIFPQQLSDAMINNKLIQHESVNFSKLGKFDKVLDFIELYNIYAIKDEANIGQLDYIKLTYKQNKSLTFDFGKYDMYLLKLHKFIIYDKLVIGAMLAVFDDNNIIGIYRVYFNPESVKSILSKLKNEYSGYIKQIETITNKTMNTIIAYPINFNKPSKSIINNYVENLGEFRNYFMELLVNPIKINIRSSKELISTTKYNEGIYNRYIYKLFIHELIFAFNKIDTTNIKNTFISIISKAKESELKTFSLNLINEIKDTCIKKHKNEYDENIIIIAIDSTIQYLQTNSVNSKYKETYIGIIKNSKTSLNNIFIDNLMLRDSAYIKSAINKYALKNINIVSNINYSLNTVDDITLNNRMFYEKSGKLNMLKSDFAELLNIAANDLSNPFKKHYLFDDNLYSSIINNSKFNYFKNELIYISTLN